ncbi:MAG: hypothetical protein IK066_09335, partial [Kiritimatiellae bacterium]|nr:hypothetical protein [Kiritimatiellia bacterium]
AAAALGGVAWPRAWPFGAWACVGGVAWLEAALALAKRWGGEAEWTGVAHYAGRVAMSALALWMLWGWLCESEGVAEEVAKYELGPLLWGVALWPVGRVLREAERAGRGGRGVTRARAWVTNGQRALTAVGAAVVVSGVFVEMRKDYPVDPSIILAVTWTMVAGYAAWCWARAAEEGGGGEGRKARAMDDAAPAAGEEGKSGEEKTPLKFGGDDW